MLTKLTDGTHVTPHYVEQGVPFLSVKDISSGHLSFEKCKYISKEEHSGFFSRCNPQYGDILLSKVGTTGIPVIVDCKEEFSIFVSIALLKFDRNIINDKFLLYLIQSPLVQVQAAENTKGVGNKNWVMRDIAHTLVVLPPLPEQHRIVAAVEDLLPKVVEYENAELELSEFEAKFHADLKKAILQFAVEGKLVPQDTNDEPVERLLERIAEERKALVKAGKLKRDKHESVIFRGSDRLTYETRNGETVCIEDELPFKIPESWAWVRLGSVSNYGQCTGTDNAPKGSWMLDLEDIERGGRLLAKNRTRESRSTKHVFMRGQVLYSKLRTYLQKVLVADEDGYCTSEIIPITFFGAINPHFATLVLNSPYFVDYTQECCCGVKMPRLTTEDARAGYFPLPPLIEQQRIVDEVERLEAQVAQLP